MQFNEGKCKVMHIGQNNPRYEYTMNGQTLSTEDARVYVNHILKPGNQCKKALVKAGQVLRQITKNFHYRDRKRTWRCAYNISYHISNLHPLIGHLGNTET